MFTPRTDPYSMAGSVRQLADFIEDIGAHAQTQPQIENLTLEEHTDWNRDYNNNSLIFTWIDNTTGMQKNVNMNELFELMESIQNREAELTTEREELVQFKDSIEERLTSLEFFLDNEEEPENTQAVA
jgi:hypothetical protein